MSRYEGYSFGQPVKQRAAVYGGIPPTSPPAAAQPQAQSPRNYRNTVQLTSTSAIYGSISSDSVAEPANSATNNGTRRSNPMLSAKPVGYNSSLSTPQPAPKGQTYGSFMQTSPPPPSSSPAPPPPNQNAAARPVSMPPGALAPINPGIAAPNSAQTPQSRLGALPPPTTAAPVSLSTGVVHRAGPIVPKIPASVPVVAKPPVVPKIPANIPTVSIPAAPRPGKACRPPNLPTHIQSIPPAYTSPAAPTSQPPPHAPSHPPPTVPPNSTAHALAP
eukprot:TRINITY_DN3041_c0_g2_i1.p1 TRINITY_DN3041_c0_g2~~TRINITY_DN3041_c0_g2_i1.p1  ORF type:complete len:275 (-),score=28.76 TRINITY_DN3041_c0_g2_i1:20-844(-)